MREGVAETVSRALLMLRLTGWLSLCKRVRDASGRIRGNIYAQHDEPLSAHDAEVFDPGWLDAVEEACRHGNRTGSPDGASGSSVAKSDSAMRHRHSRVAIIEVRLSGYQSPQAMANSRREQDERRMHKTELSQNHPVRNRTQYPNGRK